MKLPIWSITLRLAFSEPLRCECQVWNQAKLRNAEKEDGGI